MEPATLVALFALPFALLMLWLVARAPQIGRLRSAAWLVTIGAVLLALEDPALSLWYALAPTTLDPHGVADLAHGHTRAHMIGAGTWALLAFGISIWLAHAHLKRGDRTAWRVLAIVLAVGVTVDVVAYLSLYSHGLPFGAVGGFGWQPVVIGIASWAAGLLVSRSSVSAATTG